MKKIVIVAVLGAIILSGCSEKETYKVEPWETRKVEGMDVQNDREGIQKQVMAKLLSISIKMKEEETLNTAFVSPNTPYVEEMSELTIGNKPNFEIEITAKDFVLASSQAEGAESQYFLFENVGGQWLLYRAAPLEYFADPKTFVGLTLAGR